jgi:hypothetical protein
MRTPPIITTTLASLLLATSALAATPQELLAGYGGSPQAARGEAFFNARHGKDWSCASCHGARPVQPGRHSVTGKTIEPLAPAATRSVSPMRPRPRSGSAATATTCSAANAAPARRPTCWPGCRP